MRFTKLRLTGLTAIDLPIVGALPSDHYILKAADGLGPPEVDVSIQDTLNAGGYYHGRRPQNREVVIRIGLNPDYSTGQTAAELRSEFYGMLTPGADDSITLDILDDVTVLATITGYVKKLEIAPFSKDPELQITFACTSPYLSGINRIYVDPGDKTNPVLSNAGTAPTGFHMEITLTAAMSSWSLTDLAGKQLQFTYDFLAGDTIVFDTRPGYRSISLTRNGVTASLFQSLTTDSQWLTLHGGDNSFVTSSPSFNWGDVYYVPQYWGI